MRQTLCIYHDVRSKYPHMWSQLCYVHTVQVTCRVSLLYIRMLQLG